MGWEYGYATCNPHQPEYPSACAVVGRLDLQSSIAGGNLDGAYWRYETWLKTLESCFGSVLGANGAIYAFRRERYQLLPKEAIVDDFLIPMLMRLRSGGKVFFVPTARCSFWVSAGTALPSSRAVAVPIEVRAASASALAVAAHAAP